MKCINLYNLILENFSVCLPTFNHALSRLLSRKMIAARPGFRHNDLTQARLQTTVLEQTRVQRVEPVLWLTTLVKAH